MTCSNHVLGVKMNKIEVKLTVPLLDTITSNDREHWAQRSRRARNLRDFGRFHTAKAIGQNQTPIFEKAHCVVHISWPDKRRRDVHNWMPTIKHIIDGCIDAGLLPDDSDAHLTGPDLRVTDQIHQSPHRMALFHFEFEGDANG